MSGKIVQIIGAVVDVEFPRDELPKVYDALIVEGKHLVLEVQQQLGDGGDYCFLVWTTAFCSHSGGGYGFYS